MELGESFLTHIYLQNLASIQPRTSLLKFARSPRTDYYYRSPRCLFVAAMLGAFGGTFKKIEPKLTIPVTRAIDYEGTPYEVGFDVTVKQARNWEWSKPRVSVQGQPRVFVWGQRIGGPEYELRLPQPR